MNHPIETYREESGFDEQTWTIPLDGADETIDVSLKRTCSVPEEQGYTDAILEVINGGLQFSVVSLPPGSLRSLARFLAEYADLLEGREPAQG